MTENKPGADRELDQLAARTEDLAAVRRVLDECRVAQRAQIIRAVEAGASASDAAARVGMTYSMVYRIVRMARLNPNPDDF